MILNLVKCSALRTSWFTFRTVHARGRHDYALKTHRTARSVPTTDKKNGAPNRHLRRNLVVDGQDIEMQGTLLDAPDPEGCTLRHALAFSASRCDAELLQGCKLSRRVRLRTSPGARLWPSRPIISISPLTPARGRLQSTSVNCATIGHASHAAPPERALTRYNRPDILPSGRLAKPRRNFLCRKRPKLRLRRPLRRRGFARTA